MLRIIVPEREYFNEETMEFVKVKSETLQLEHSLVSVSKWESKWRKPFLGKNDKTDEETMDYIRCMTISQNVSPDVYRYIPANLLNEISEYICAPMTATWFSERETAKNSRDVITAEIIYYWMIAQNIPMECQKWHLNRLLTLIRVCSLKNTPSKKRMGRREMLANRRALNEARRNQYNTKG